ncbi:MAG: CotH kinase family protein [Saprospiraceae bacterium]
MILKDVIKKQEDKYLQRFGNVVAVLAFALLIYLLLRILFPIVSKAPRNSIICDAEVIQGKYFLGGKNTFENSQTRSAKYAFSGQYSSKVDTANPIGFLYKMRSPKGGERYKVSVWRYKTNIAGGTLVISAANKADFYKAENLAIESKDGWERLEIIFNVPPESLSYLKIYVTTNTISPVYFDNLLIEKVEMPRIVNPYNPPVVQMEIGEEWLGTLEKRRADAISTGILIESESEWTEGRILQSDKEVPLELRLKGDWLDIMRTDKWAFRVKTKKAYSWNGLQRFTLETPSVKNYLREWLFHKFLQQEDIVAPRYDFVKVQLNNKNAGVYAYEEHFDRPLLEFNNRENGPILKFSDEAYWLNLRREVSGFGEKGNRQFIQNFEVAQVQPFRQDLTQTNVALGKQFNIAKDLMYQYKHNLSPADEIFDIDKMAKFYAITDVMQAYHGMIWHNQRFYYNPKSAKIEPIGFDGFGSKVKSWRDKPFIGYLVYNKDFEDDGLYVNLFKNEDFVKAYFGYLYQYTDYQFLADILASLESDLRQRELFIQRDSASYSFDEKDILDNARHIRSYLVPFNNQSVQAYTQGFSGNAKQVKVTNHHGIPLEVVGFGNNATDFRDKLKTPKVLEVNLPNRLPKYVTFKVSQDISHVFYRIPTIDSVFNSTLQPWSAVRTQTPEQELYAQANVQNNEYYTVLDKNILFKKGTYTVNKNIVIPKGYKVNFQAGVKLNMVNGAVFLSKSPVFMAGTKAKPIEITSSDNRGNGFSVLQTTGKSTLSYVTFKNLNTLSYKGWELSGSVTFYEADVWIENCIFQNNNATSALNVVRSDFEITRSTFLGNIRQDIDVAYSQGEISYSYFNNTGGSAIDIKSCITKVTEVNITGSQEYGISAADGSSVKVKSLKVSKSTTAVVSKGSSIVDISYIDIRNCQRGFTIFKGKPELGHSEINVENYQAVGFKYLHSIEPGSILRLRGKVIKGS